LAPGGRGKKIEAHALRFAPPKSPFKPLHGWHSCAHGTDLYTNNKLYTCPTLVFSINLDRQLVPKFMDWGINVKESWGGP
jgi:hypothetical protein